MTGSLKSNGINSITQTELDDFETSAIESMEDLGIIHNTGKFGTTLPSNYGLTSST
jgi:hypothetical protein